MGFETVRRLALTLVVCVAASAVAATAYANVDARLAGPFDVRITVVRGNVDKPGDRFHRLWRFDPLCRSGPCGRVRFIREGAGGFEAESILHRIDRGTYQGRERMRVNCGHGLGVGRQVVKTHIRIKRVDRGEARKIKGRGRLRVMGCHLRERVKFVGHSLR